MAGTNRQILGVFDRDAKFAQSCILPLGFLTSPVRNWSETLAVMRITVWALALCFAAIALVSWRYLFVVPIFIFNAYYSVFDSGSLAFNEARPLVRVCFSLSGMDGQ
jgi:hypothetical protein